jgi:hypothetical protein
VRYDFDDYASVAPFLDRAEERVELSAWCGAAAETAPDEGAMTPDASAFQMTLLNPPVEGGDG